MNEVHMRVDAPEHVKMELSEHFTFLVPGYKFMPAYRNRIWDGKIRLFNARSGIIYRGLIDDIKRFADGQYDLVLDPAMEETTSFSLQEAKEFYKSLNLGGPEGKTFEERGFQLESFVHCVRNNRALFVSPTGSGKSLMIYMLLRYYEDAKTLIIVDSVNLLLQMFSDFKEYGFDSESQVHTISAGKKKESDKRIIVSTWQSASRQPRSWFEQFDVVIGDEAHKFKAKELTKIMESLTDCKYRFGFTGSLDGTKTNKLVLQGLFGPHKQIVTTKELQDDGTLADLTIKCIMLEYNEEERKQILKSKYQQEIDFLNKHVKRNKFICNLALSLDGNTLLLFRNIETHGKVLHRYIEEKAECPVYYVSGEVKGDEREQIRQVVNTHEKSITVASLGVFSTGTNIPNIDNIIMASPTKSQIMLLQSIGRGLRKTDRKQHCTFFDIVDDLSRKTKQNYTMKHFSERMKIYIQQKFKYKLYKVKLEK
jgi:superfamily II DNA or RNA helicase